MSLKVFICFLLLVPFAGHSQTISKKEMGSLFTILQQVMSKKANNSRTEAPTEMFLLALETDSNSKVDGIHLYSDSQTKDSSYFALSAITVSDFQGWSAKKCINKTIIIPIISLAPSDDGKGYLHQIFSDLFWPDIRKKTIISEKKNTILTNLFLYEVATMTKD